MSYGIRITIKKLKKLTFQTSQISKINRIIQVNTIVLNMDRASRPQAIVMYFKMLNNLLHK